MRKNHSRYPKHTSEISGTGIRVMLASARPVPGLYSAASELRLGDHHGILMAYNGGKVVDATDGQLLSQTHMDLNKTRELLRFLEALPVTVILTTANASMWKMLMDIRWNTNAGTIRWTAQKSITLQIFWIFPR